MEKPKVGLLGGTGLEGQGIALRLAAAGVALTIGSRSAEKASDLAGQLNRRLGTDLIRGAENGRVADLCDTLFLAVPFEAAAPLLDDLAGRLDGRHVLIDVTVPLVFRKGVRLLELDENSGAEFLRGRLSEAVPMATAFKTMPAHLLCDLEQPLDCDEFICWDSEEARDRALRVVGAIPGIRWLDAGPLRFSRALEAMTALVIGLNRRYRAKHGRFKVVGLPE